MPTTNAIRNKMLGILKEYEPRGPGSFQAKPILKAIVDHFGYHGNENMQQAVLTVWHDLFRSGLLSWGLNISNPDHPFIHMTTVGRKTLEHLSRDPSNPDGYLAFLRSKTALGDVAESYIAEALKAYNFNCVKATAVMVGCAAESVAFSMRDALVTKMRALPKAIPPDLEHWMIRKVLIAMANEIDSQKSSMDKRLKEAYEANWSSFTHQIRVSRNDAGHPTIIDPVSEETVHASLLIFPELASLTNNLIDWINSKYV